MLLLRAKFLGFPAVDNGETHQSSLQIDSFEDNCCYCKGIRTFFFNQADEDGHLPFPW